MKRPDRQSADLELVRRALTRDSRDLDALARRLVCIVRALATKNAKLGRPFHDDELADVAQDVALVVWRKLPEYEGRAALEGWVYRIALFEFMNALRRKRSRLPSATSDEAEVAVFAEEHPWKYEALHAALDGIEGDEAEVLQLKHYDDLTFREIAGRLQLSASAAKARYYRGMRKLRDRLKPKEVLES